MFSIRRHCQKYYRIFYSVRCLLAFLLIALFVLFTLFSKPYQLQKKFTDSSKTNVNSTSIASKQLTLQDSYYLVTAISSREFKWMLKFIGGVILEDEFELIIWSLNLRDCEFNYLRNLKTAFRIHIHRFPYHFYGLHIRSYQLTAIKPIIMQSSAIAFGEVIWIEPSGKLLPQIKHLIKILNDKGFVAASSSKQVDGNCLTDAIGVNYIQYKTFLDSWVECAKTNSCIAKISNENKVVNGVDMLFEHFRKERKIRCVFIKSLGVPSSDVLNHWKSNEKELCPLHKACVLTGSHATHKCLTPQLNRLRQNKIKYTDRRGYAYIEETFGFHKHSPCHRVWNKVHAILKYLGDCELLLWIDTDAVFLNTDKTLESFFDTRSNIEFLATWPPAGRMFNAGVLLMRNTPTVRELFQNVTSGRTWTDNWCNHSKFEQAAIRDQLDSGMMGGKFEIERNDELQTLCSYKKKDCVVSEKDFIAHFAPSDCPELPDLVKTFLDRNPQYVD